MKLNLMPWFISQTAGFLFYDFFQLNVVGLFRLDDGYIRGLSHYSSVYVLNLL